MTKHELLAMAWAQYAGRRGTAKQIAPIMRQLSEADLVRMLAERNIHLADLQARAAEAGLSVE